LNTEILYFKKKNCIYFTDKTIFGLDASGDGMISCTGVLCFHFLTLIKMINLQKHFNDISVSSLGKTYKNTD